MYTIKLRKYKYSHYGLFLVVDRLLTHPVHFDRISFFRHILTGNVDESTRIKNMRQWFDILSIYLGIIYAYIFCNVLSTQRKTTTPEFWCVQGQIKQTIICNHGDMTQILCFVTGCISTILVMVVFQSLRRLLYWFIKGLCTNNNFKKCVSADDRDLVIFCPIDKPTTFVIDTKNILLYCT